MANLVNKGERRVWLDSSHKFDGECFFCGVETHVWILYSIPDGRYLNFCVNDMGTYLSEYPNQVQRDGKVDTQDPNEFWLKKKQIWPQHWQTKSYYCKRCHVESPFKVTVKRNEGGDWVFTAKCESCGWRFQSMTSK